ncbi:MAG: methylated-DNA--[protein]-cysteine S-methyltransferase [Tannerella sp.]|nr:methylated-DNA--[protein]-cysteine S-methyltransferase [Tannerella sp.]
MNYYIIYNSPIGAMRIIENGEAITAIKYLACNPDNPPEATEKETELIKEAVAQLKDYFSGSRKTFDLPVQQHGTAFQKRVWDALSNIPYGETRTYKQTAEAIGCPKGARAVGLANNRNPISILVPCHRVIGADGKLTGYAGGLDAKQKLLNLEKGNYIGQKHGCDS